MRQPNAVTEAVFVVVAGIFASSIWRLVEIQWPTNFGSCLGLACGVVIVLLVPCVLNRLRRGT
jgi:hypothetical protein